MPRFTLLATLIAFSSLSYAEQSKEQPQTKQDLEAKINSLSDEVSQLSKKFGNIEIGGRIQLDYNYFNGAYNADNDGKNAQELFPRRIRTYVESEFEDWDYKLLLDFSEGNAEIVMARLRYSGFGHGLKIQAGKLREDISLNALTSSKHIALIERSMLANTLSPYFRWGVSANQYFKGTGLRYAVGVYKNDAFGSSGKDKYDAMDLAASGRLTWANIDSAHGFHAGVWHSERQMSNDKLGQNFARGELRETNVRLLNYAAGGDEVALDGLSQTGIEFAFQHKSLLVEAEYGQRTLETTDSASSLDGETFGGYYLQASYFLTGEHRSYSKGSAVFKQPKDVRNAWEIAARLSSMDATSKLQGTEVQTYTIGASYYFNPKTKVMANFVRSEVDGPGAEELVGTEVNGNAFAARIQYLF